MRRVNKILVTIIILLVVLVLVLGGYIIYDKALFNDNDLNDTVLLSEQEALEITKDLTSKYFEYYHSLGPYCGEVDNEDYISFGSYETRDFRDYWASTTYKSINDIREYYKSFMVEDLLPKYLDDGVSYLEQDGKLYCQLAHKGCGDIYNEEASYYTIDSIVEDTIVSNVILASNTCGEELNRREGMVTIIKNLDGKWLISKYDVQLSLID